MEPSSSQWPQELESDDLAFLHQCENLSSLNEEVLHDNLFSDIYTFNSSGSASYSLENPNNFETNLRSSSTADQAPCIATFASPPSKLTFGNDDQEIEEIVTSHGSQWNFDNQVFKGSERSNMVSTRPSSCSQEHVIAERKRREKLNQLFIKLTEIISPWPKKTDKASLLSDAIDYIRQLETRVKALEEKALGGLDEEPAADHMLKRSHQSYDNKASFNSALNPSFGCLLNIAARLTDKTILLRIYCEERKGVVVKVLSEIEKLRLAVVGTSVIPFEGTSLNITVTTKIEDGFSMTVEDIVRDLESSLRQVM